MVSIPALHLPSAQGTDTILHLTKRDGIRPDVTMVTAVIAEDGIGKTIVTSTVVTTVDGDRTGMMDTRIVVDTSDSANTRTGGRFLKIVP